MKKNSLITFDYEVFLGKDTGTVEKSVLLPTRAILDVLTKNKAKALFFVDATWLLFLKEHFPGDFGKVAEQLKDIVAAGSSVELHLHPQWLDARVENGKIVFDSLRHYKLHSLDEDQIIALFERSVELLVSVTAIKPTCFRAGGWCIEPFEKLKASFINAGIIYDLSVAPGMYIDEGKEYDYDYRKVPSGSLYRFENSPLKIVENGSFTEIPVSTYPNNFVLRSLNKVILKLKRDKVFGDGSGAKAKSLKKSFAMSLKFSKGMLTLDKTCNIVFRLLIKTYFRRSDLIVAVSHPKIVSGEALSNLSFLTGNTLTHNAGELATLAEKFQA